MSHRKNARRERQTWDNSVVNPDPIQEEAKKVTIKYLNRTQKRYGDSIRHCDITFGIGMAGTGKTWLGALHAAEALVNHQVERIVVCRPAVEAGGEKIGFLPGGINEKMDPYIRPIWDAFRQVWHPKTIQSYVQMGIIEVVPLGYMRGRTFRDSMIIADEMQNATREQLLMLLTRLGEGSKMIITGDPTQCDIYTSPFSFARHRLGHLRQVAFVEFGIDDVVRHPTVEAILHAWEPNTEKTVEAEPEPINGHAALGHLPMMQPTAAAA